MKDEAASPSRESALRHHRAGDLATAAAQYGSLLRGAPDDPNILGLAGIVDLQRGDAAEAERKLRRALSETADSLVALRNLNSLVVLLIQSGRTQECDAVVDSGVPDPAAAGRPPEPGELGAILSLGEALIKLSRPEAAIRLLSGTPAEGRHEARLFELLGRARMAAGHAVAAIEPLERACACVPGSAVEPQIALGVACHMAGQGEKARRIAEGVAQSFPIHVAPKQPGHEATLLVINPKPRVLTQAAATLETLHFRHNFVAQAAMELSGHYRFASVFPVRKLPRLLPRLPGPDLVISNLAVPEKVLGSDEREALLEFLGALDVPVMNHPARTESLTRETVAGLISDCPGLRVPRVLRVRGDAARSAAPGDLPREFPYPAILRSSTVHSSSSSAVAGKDISAFLARTPRQAAEWVGYGGLSDFYMIEFVDLERAGGVFRRIRAMVMDDEIVIHSVSFYDHWLVGGWRIGKHAERFYDAHPHCIEAGGRIISDPEGALGREPLAALRRLRERVPLDIFGIDFDIDMEGRIVVFEVSPAMVFLPVGQIPERLRPLSVTPGEISAAFARLVRRRIASVGCNR